MNNTAFANATLTNATALPAITCRDESIVPWQSAFWALLTLALSAMTQPSDADPYPDTAISLVRSSPFTCLTDSLSVLVWLAVGRFYGKSSSNSLASKRLAIRPHGITGRAPVFSPTTSAVFFILGPLPQAVKLAGMTDVPCTQVFGSVFLVAYLLGVYQSHAVDRARRRHVENPTLSFAVKAQRIPETLRIRLAWYSMNSALFFYFIHAYLWVVTAYIVAGSSIGGDKQQVTVIEAIRVMNYQYPILGIALPTVVYVKKYLEEWLSERSSGTAGLQRMRPVLRAGLLYVPAVLCGFSAFGLSVFVTKLVWNYYTPEPGQEHRLGWKAYADTKEALANVSMLLLVLSILLICIPLVSLGLALVKFMLDKIMKPQPEIEETAQENEGKEVFFNNTIGLGYSSSNLIFTMLFYAYVYDAEGTSKSGWSEMLG